MHGARFGKSESERHGGGATLSHRRVLGASGVGLLTVVLLGMLILVPGRTAADPTCTDSWTGAAGDGLWRTAENWSTSAVPDSSDVVCIGSGVTVRVTGGADQAGVLSDEGILEISGGSLELASSTEASSVESLTLSSGTLTGADTLEVSGSLSWTGGSMTGAGATTLEPDATGSIDPAAEGSVALTERKLINEGALTWSSGSVEGRSDAEIDNSGTFEANADEAPWELSYRGLVNGDGSDVWFENTGTLKKSVGSEYTGIQFQIDNEGTVEGETGQIVFQGGSHGSNAATGSWDAEETGSLAFSGGTFLLGSGVKMAGEIWMAGGSIQAGDIQGPSAHILLWANDSTLDLTDASTASHLKELSVQAAAETTTLTGAGTVDVSGSLLWTAGSMTGSGKTVVEPGATGSIDAGVGNAVALTERELVNEGTLTWSSGSVEGRSDAEIDNSGTFWANAGVSCAEWSTHGLLKSDGSNVWLRNTGTMKKTSAGECEQIQWQIDNEGTVESKSNQIQITGGDHPGVVGHGSWSGVEGGIIVFVGSYVLGSDVEMAGLIALIGAQIQVEDIQGPEATISLSTVAGSELDLTSTSTASHLGTLNIESGGTLTGAGELDIAGSLAWTGGSMTGSGKTVVESGATGSIDPGFYNAVSLTERELVNEGTLTWSSGSVEGRSDAEIDNSGTFWANAGVSCAEWSTHGLLNKDGSNVWFRNTGTVKKTSAGECEQIQWQIDNDGSIESKDNQIQITGGDHPGAVGDGSWSGVGGGTIVFVGSYTFGSGVGMTGNMWLVGAQIQAEDIQGSEATVGLASVAGTELDLTGTSTASHVGTLDVQSGAVLTGAGTLDVVKELSWTGGSMTGSGKTVVESGATGAVEASSWCGSVDLVERGLVNEGTTTFGSGAWFMSDGARLENGGTFNDNSEASCYGPQIQVAYGSSTAPSILNEGIFEKTSGGGTSTVAVNFSNQEVVEAETGTLDFSDGGIPEETAAGSWAVQSGAHIVLSGGTFLIGEDVDLSAVEVSGATVEREPTSGPPKGHLEPHPYASGVVTISGRGASVGTGFSSATIEVTPAGESEWHTLCGLVSPGLTGEYSCSWNTASGFYPDGSYQLRAQLSDASEPPATAPTATITVLVDNTAPTGSLTAPSYIGGTSSISGTAEDSGSGVASWQLQIAAEGSSEWASACPEQTTPTSGTTYACDVNTTGFSDGSYQLRAVITDRAGNGYTTSVVDTSIDNTPPTGSLDTVAEGEYTYGTISLQGTAADTGSGVASWTPQVEPVGGGTWADVCSEQTTPITGSTYGCSLNTTTLTDGEYKIRAEVRDNTGNVYDTSTQTITIDNTPPTGVLDSLPRTSSGTVDIRGTASDAISGVASWTLEIAPADNSSWEQACLPLTLPIEGAEYGCSFDTTTLSDGAYQLRATITDHAGHSYATPAIAAHFDNSGTTEPSCTDTWTGDAGDGSWQSAGNWSTEAPPTSSDVVCIGSGATVNISSGANAASWIEGEGSLNISGGTFEVTNSDVASTAATLKVSGGTLGGANEIDVSEELSWTGGSMIGSGKTVVQSGATASIDPGAENAVALTEREFVNDGTLTWSSGSVEGRSNAELNNSGTLITNAQASGYSWWEWWAFGLLNSDGSNVWLKNTGTVKKTAGSESTQIQFQIDNEGVVEANTGQIILSGGSHASSTGSGSWHAEEGASMAFSNGSFSLGSGVEMSGAIYLAGGDVQAPDIQAPTATLLLWSGGSTLTLTDASTPSNVGALEMYSSTTLTGAGTLDVSGSLNWGNESTMSGTGKTVLESGTSAVLLPGEDGCEGVRLIERTFVNEGVLTFGASSSDGSLAMSEGARLENMGIFHDNPEPAHCTPFFATIVQGAGSKVEPKIINTGTFDETESRSDGITTTVNVPFENDGTFDGKASALGFGPVPVTLNSASVLKGRVGLVGANATAGSFLGAGADLTLTGSGSLSILSGDTATVNSLSFEKATVTGAGTLNILSGLNWEFEGTMSGTGKTVLEGGASGSILTEGPNWCDGVHLARRTFVNNGTVILGTTANTGGSMVMSNDAQINNNGKFLDISPAWYCSPWEYTIVEGGGGPAPKIVNTGTFARTEN